MAKETVNAVKEAELKALEVEVQAKKNYDRVLFKAKEEAKCIIEREMSLAQEQGKRELEEARSRGEKITAEIVQRATAEKVRLEEVTRTKEQLAIKLILSEMI